MNAPTDDFCQQQLEQERLQMTLQALDAIRVQFPNEAAVLAAECGVTKLFKENEHAMEG